MIRLAFLTLLLCVIAACSKPASTAGDGQTGAGEAARQVSSSDTAPPSLDCAKIFTPADVAPVVPGTATISGATGAGNICVFKISNGSTIQISFDGDTERALWDNPNQRQLGKYLPVSGVRDEAFARTSEDSAQAYIRKGEHYCGVVAGLNEAKVMGDALVRALAPLCDKGFTAH